MTNKIKRINKEFTIQSKEDELIWTLNKKDEKVLIYNKEMVENIFELKINKKYRDILLMLMEENDDSEGEEEIVRNKIEELKRLIMDKYYQYISPESLKRYIKRITLLESQIKPKERGKSR